MCFYLAEFRKNGLIYFQNTAYVYGEAYSIIKCTFFGQSLKNKWPDFSLEYDYGEEDEGSFSFPGTGILRVLVLPIPRDR
jgi:hypothetical protein